MIIYKKCLSFQVLNQEINLITEPYLDGVNTVAEINEKYIYLGNQSANILSAILSWELFYNKEISEDDFIKVLIDNKFE